MKKISELWQLFLWYIGIAWHNTKKNECTPDFNCCNKIGRFAFIRIEPKQKKTYLLNNFERKLIQALFAMAILEIIKNIEKNKKKHHENQN